jgi:N-formylglutamate amidohydrolase
LCSATATAPVAPAWWPRPGNPSAGLHAIQLEINRALYMDERRYERTAHFDRLAADLETVARRLGEIPLEELRPYRAAAE